jgi:hypothetical protein
VYVDLTDRKRAEPAPSPGGLRLSLVQQAYDAVSMAAVLLWLVLFVLCWPLALAALVLYPVIWILLLPFRIVGVAVDGVLALVKAVLLLPARLLGGGPRGARG